MIDIFIIGVIIFFVNLFLLRFIFKIDDIVTNLENQTELISEQKNELIKGIDIQNKYLRRIDKNLSSILEKNKSNGE